MISDSPIRGGGSTSDDTVSTTSSDTDSNLGSWADDTIDTSDDYDADGGLNSGSSTSDDSDDSGGDLTDPDNYESDVADSADDAAGDASDYGDFDAGGMEGVDGEVTYTIDQYGEAFVEEDEDGNDQLMAPDGFELDGDEQEALGDFLSGGDGGAEPDNTDTQSGEDVQARIDDLLAEQRAAYEERMSALMEGLPVPDQLGGSDSGGGLSPALGGVALLALGAGALYVQGGS